MGIRGLTPRRYQRLRATLDRRQPDLTVLLEHVHKGHNLSAILRTCDAVGVFEAHAWSPTGAVKRHRNSSVGAAKWVGIHVHREVEGAVETLKREGLQIVAAHLAEGSVDYREIDYTLPTAVLMGQEKDGVSAAALAAADHSISIPMQGLVASLNVSVATAVILFEAQRQRAAAGLYDRPRLDPETYTKTLFEWGYPELAAYCRETEQPYPRLDEEGALLDPAPA